MEMLERIARALRTEPAELVRPAGIGSGPPIIIEAGDLPQDMHAHIAMFGLQPDPWFTQVEISDQTLRNSYQSAYRALLEAEKHYAEGREVEAYGEAFDISEGLSQLPESLEELPEKERRAVLDRIISMMERNLALMRASVAHMEREEHRQRLRRERAERAEQALRDRLSGLAQSA